MLKLKLKKDDYDFLDGVAHDIFDFSSGIDHYGMTPSPEYEITAIGNRMEYIHDKYFGMLIKH